MRKLSGKLQVDEETFEPRKNILLDGEETGTSIPITMMMDAHALHGDEFVGVLIDGALADIDLRFNLSDDEKRYFKENFRELVGL